MRRRLIATWWTQVFRISSRCIHLLCRSLWSRWRSIHIQNRLKARNFWRRKHLTRESRKNGGLQFSEEFLDRVSCAHIHRHMETCTHMHQQTKMLESSPLVRGCRRIVARLQCRTTRKMNGHVSRKKVLQTQRERPRVKLIEVPCTQPRMSTTV